MAASVDDINTALKTATDILAQLTADKRSSPELEKEFADIKGKIAIDAAASTVDSGVWEKLKPSDQEAVLSTLRSYIDKLRRANRSKLTGGYWTFTILAILLTVLACIYLGVHASVASSKSKATTTSSSAIDDGLLTRVVKSADAMDDLATAIAGLQTSKENAKETDKAEIDTKLASKFKSMQEAAATLSQSFAENNLQSQLSFDLLSKWAKVLSHIETQNAAGLSDSFKSFRKQLDPELQSLRTHYFWTDIPGRWFEIAWWAEFGTLIGLLFYLAGCLQTGVFRTEELTMYVTEVLITPFVVTVVFFLFGFSGISAFNPSEASIIATVGFAFILGFAIRRTVGLLDTIKKRFLPDPSPADKTAS
jgi:hypothetical protein